MLADCVLLGGGLGCLVSDGWLFADSFACVLFVWCVVLWVGLAGLSFGIGLCWCFGVVR